MPRHERPTTGPTQFRILEGEIVPIDDNYHIDDETPLPRGRDHTNIFGPIDPRYIAWETARPPLTDPVAVENPDRINLPCPINGNLTETSRPLAACLNCNTNSAPLGNRVQCTSILFYLVYIFNRNNARLNT
jgi:hypothetical protein